MARRRSCSSAVQTAFKGVLYLCIKIAHDILSLAYASIVISARRLGL